MLPSRQDVALARAYRSAVGARPPAGAAADAGDDALGCALRGLFDEGARAWPGVELAAEVFVAHVAQVSRLGPELLPLERGPDLFLACACARLVPGALTAFERAHLARMRAYLAPLRPTPQLVDDVRQEVREKLFLGRDGAAPRIVEYDGRGALGSWVRVVALRAAIDLGRRGGAAAETGGPAAKTRATADPERVLQDEQHRQAVASALRGAVVALGSEQRRLLRRHFADGATLEALAAETGVHRATVARRLAEARTALRRDARRRLRAAIGGTEADMDRLAAELRSQLDLSLPSLLRTV